MLGSALPRLRLLEPDGAYDAGTQMERIRHVRHTSLRIHSVPLHPPRQSEESQGDSGRWPDPWDLWRAIGWPGRDHNRHLNVLAHGSTNHPFRYCGTSREPAGQPWEQRSCSRKLSTATLSVACSICPWVPASLKLYLFIIASLAGEQGLGISRALSLPPALERLIIH